MTMTAPTAVPDYPYAHRSRCIRGVLALSYALCAVSGALLLLDHATAQSTYGPLTYTGAVFMVLGGGLAAIGAFRGRWLGEFTGLPLLCSALLALAIQVLVQRWGLSPYIALANFNFLTGMAMGMTARWRVALASFRLTRFLAATPDTR